MMRSTNPCLLYFTSTQHNDCTLILHVFCLELFVLWLVILCLFFLYISLIILSVNWLPRKHRLLNNWCIVCRVRYETLLTHLLTYFVCQIWEFHINSSVLSGVWTNVLMGIVTQNKLGELVSVSLRCLHAELLTTQHRQHGTVFLQTF